MTNDPRSGQDAPITREALRQTAHRLPPGPGSRDQGRRRAYPEGVGLNYGYLEGGHAQSRGPTPRRCQGFSREGGRQSDEGAIQEPARDDVVIRRARVWCRMWATRVKV